MKLKRILGSIVIISTMIMGSLLTVSASTTHEHTYAGNYSYEEAYSRDETCLSHEACTMHIQYMNVFDSCTSCGFRTYVRTEMRIRHEIPLIDRLF